MRGIFGCGVLCVGALSARVSARWESEGGGCLLASMLVRRAEAGAGSDAVVRADGGAERAACARRF